MVKNVDYGVQEISGGDVTATGFKLSPSGAFWSRLHERIVIQGGEERRSNPDMDPVPPEKRTWSAMDYITYWISDNFSPSGWRKAASLMQIGMSWKLALINVAVSEVIIALVVTANGVVGARYRIPFSVQSRAAFGYYFSYLMIAMRMIVGIFWYGTSAYTGAECVRSMIYAIWPSFHHVENRLPAHANITTQFMIAYFIYWVSILPLHYIHISKIRFLFTIKAITLPIIGFGMMGWTIKNAGVGNNSLWTAGNTVHGTALRWVFMQGVYSNIGGWATLAINSPDFTRYSKRVRNTYTMAIALPFTATLIAFFGVVGAGGSKVLWGTILWDPLLFIDNWTSKGGRAAAFFCALGFYLSQACSNISANSISAANDLNCMFPRYINIRRGQFIVSILGTWALTPWNILTSATSFLSFMSGYTVWLAPICGILVSDYYFVHNRKYNVWELYEQHGIYRYNKYGINWRAAAAFTIGWVPLLPGFLPKVNSSIKVIQGMTNLYYCGYFYGFGSSMLTYWIFCTLWPAKETMLDYAVYVDDEVLTRAGGDVEEGVAIDTDSLAEKTASESEKTK
ncbi:permease for cytosine/purines, uracil, thiamine, allantoin-domain-containing protein [Lipomyces doorenjongii]|uniref:permease for cytosine/purines, uracil, thiamine, allantoin-domain-containing protein n=1 Tax=Lipomyces doorenjongii TaxID=383834 RepID=UPI0034CD801C